MYDSWSGCLQNAHRQCFLLLNGHGSLALPSFVMWDRPLYLSSAALPLLTLSFTVEVGLHFLLLLALFLSSLLLKPCLTLIIIFLLLPIPIFLIIPSVRLYLAPLISAGYFLPLIFSHLVWRAQRHLRSYTELALQSGTSPKGDSKGAA